MEYAPSSQFPPKHYHPSQDEHFEAASLSNRSSLLHRAIFAHEFRDVFRLAGISGLLLPVVAGLARLLGKGVPPSR